MQDKTATHSFPAATAAVRVVIATFFPQFAFGLSYVWIGLAPHVRQENGWSSLIIGVIFALTPLSSALTLLISGRLATMFPPRRLCWLGMGLLIAGLAVAFILPNEFTFLVFYAMLALGVGYGIILPASLAAIAQVFPKHLGTAGGALTAAYALAAIAEVPVISLLISGHSWIDALRIVGSIVTVLAVIALLFMPPLPKSREQVMEGILPLHLLKQPHLLTSVLLVVSVAPLGTYATSQVGIYAQDLGLIAAISTAAVIFVALGNTIGRLVGGIASDYLGVNRVLFVIIILDVVAAVLLWRTSSAGILVAASGVVGLACGGLIGTVPRLATDAAPGAFNSATGLLFAGFSLGGFIGPVIGSALGGRVLAWLVLGGITVFGQIIIVLHMVDATRQQRKNTKSSVFPTRSY